MVQHFFHKTFTALLVTFAYTLLLVHNLVPHHHHDEANQHLLQHQEHHHAQEYSHAAEHPDHDHEQAEKPVADPDHLLSNHQHPFADNTTFHTQESNEAKISKRQVVTVLICFLNFQYHLFHLPDRKPPSPVYLFSYSTFFSRSHTLRGPPVS